MGKAAARQPQVCRRSGQRWQQLRGQVRDGRSFDAGLEKFIILPDPKVLEAILIEHCHFANSDMPFTTSNYNLTSTPKEDLECALNPDQLKTYLGAGPGHNHPRGSCRCASCWRRFAV